MTRKCARLFPNAASSCKSCWGPLASRPLRDHNAPGNHRPLVRPLELSRLSSFPEKLAPGVTRHVPSGGVERLTPDQLAPEIRRVAGNLGFARVGFTTADPFVEDARRLDDWRRRGWHGEMSFLADPAERTAPERLLPQAQTVISVALPHARSVIPAGALRGGVARYALGSDYHRVLKRRLKELADQIAQLTGPLLARACVDTAPLTEHAVAARAGVGFTGRNSLTIVPGVGSYVLLGELLVDAEIVPDAPLSPRCGRCTRCLDACPTGAFAGPYELDARRCISYLTIELRGSIPRPLRPLIGNRVFGCDVCQEVCPYNRVRRRLDTDPELAPRPSLVAPDLVELLWLGSAAHRRLTRGTALERVSRARLARNAVVALGNSGDAAATGPVADALAHHSSPLVRGHAAWALGHLRGRKAAGLLEQAAAGDPDAFVREEAETALAERHLDPPERQA